MAKKTRRRNRRRNGELGAEILNLLSKSKANMTAVQITKATRASYPQVKAQLARLVDTGEITLAEKAAGRNPAQYAWIASHQWMAHEDPATQHINARSKAVKVSPAESPRVSLLEAIHDVKQALAALESFL